MEFTKWTDMEAYEWALDNFGEETASCFKEQEIDGETLEALVTGGGSVEQMALCGFKTVKQQLQFKKLLLPLVPGTATAVHMHVTTPTATSGKLSRTAIKNLKAEDKRVYLIKRNRVSEAAKKQWPGNNLPKFKNNAAMQKQLDNLVEQLLPTCEAPNFGKDAIRKHILDNVNERRRQIRKGYDYQNPPKSFKKSKGAESVVKEASNDKSAEETSNNKSAGDTSNDNSAEETSNDKSAEETSNNKSTEEADNDKLAEETSNNQSAEETSNDKSRMKRKRKIVHLANSTSEESDLEEDAGPIASEMIFTFDALTTKQKRSKDDERQMTKDGEYSEESAVIIVMCAFGALSIKSVSRSQLASAGRFFLKGEQRKWITKADKQQLINVLAPCFVDSGVVVVKEVADINNLSTSDVVKEGTF